MIQAKNESEVTVLGDFQSYEASIDAKNLNHIITILSSNLYAHPMQSFLRETVSNAVDSHVEAGVDEPIIITTTGKSISIRDYGTGISPERFKNIYINIGSSTKRESNDYIGAFGIGRFSALSVSDVVNVTSFYNGKAYYYLMNRDLSKLHIDLLDVKDTTEKNGVEVKVVCNKDAISLKKDIEKLGFIKNLVWIDEEFPSFTESFNERKVISYENFKVTSSFDKSHYVLVGNIPYKYEFSEFFDSDRDDYRYWCLFFKNIFPQVKIGSVEVTPNREALLYSDMTKQEMRKVINSCVEELKGIIAKQYTKVFDDFSSYLEAIHSFSGDVNLGIINVNLRYDASCPVPCNYTYPKHPEWCNIPIKVLERIVSTIYNYKFDTVATWGNDTLSLNSPSSWRAKCNVSNLIRQSDDKFVMLNSRAGMTSKYLPYYLTDEKYPYTYFLINLYSLRYNIQIWLYNFYECSRGVYDIGDYKVTLHTLLQFAKEVLKVIIPKLDTTNIFTTPEYLLCRKKYKEHKEAKPKTSFPVDVITYRADRLIDSNCYTNLEQAIARKGNLGRTSYATKGIIAYCDRDTPWLLEVSNFKFGNLTIFKCARTNFPYLEKYFRNTRAVPLKSLFTLNNRSVRRTLTIKYLMEHDMLPFLSGIIESTYFPDDILSDVHRLRTLVCSYGTEYCNKYGAEQLYARLVANPDLLDGELVYLAHRTAKHIKFAQYVTHHVDNTFKMDFIRAIAKKRILPLNNGLLLSNSNTLKKLIKNLEL